MRPKILFPVILVIFVLIFIIIKFAAIDNRNIKPLTQNQQNASQAPDSAPAIISTKPDPLDNTIISAAEIIEITFNRPLENVGEFKVKIEPNIEYKVELSGDRKTAKIIPVKPYNLGASYTLSIGPDSKFDGVGSWGKDKTYHFRTIKYTGV
ncbi:MAG: hypothetical protein ACD_38C00193G0003 [uncultured bacterium]|uniref:SbsA Ig-like domain-containing protein n=1 Tax=Candidatus Daviesbacteria bacterium GW2011_GWC2_40_12 TaxID=1618431 RepID=A0A0G0QN33_9BACT|nr:MAG: hypothetical protein ACD_38C00193G0003 [uncultured bacterium]KKR41568.1 MAG: hypothetical protein UT77_C0009G0026 [Candidatus Daviesbacteria bacterium GW2011_GWC2_40_12]OGE28594.1 MAG: hypothetical protein A3C29_03250 [Candidatus Daviesbacteria bacterium RIFCSPHIGHO2_02_FULL_40_16]OGE66352.1 MAG: hypothetical protein A3J16_05140 [Candidatus Daviesbacteria bacterium RIFCSPLOWO2_02_FULL_39_13]HCE30761.1 hypothetical protein [Candidatus Daviesbacteria bacterium]